MLQAMSAVTLCYSAKSNKCLDFRRHGVLCTGGAKMQLSTDVFSPMVMDGCISQQLPQATMAYYYTHSWDKHLYDRPAVMVLD